MDSVAWKDGDDMGSTATCNTAARVMLFIYTPGKRQAFFLGAVIFLFSSYAVFQHFSVPR